MFGFFDNTMKYYKNQKSLKKLRSADEQFRRLQLQMQQELKRILHSNLVDNPKISKIEIYVDRPDIFQNILATDTELQQMYSYEQVPETEGRCYYFSENYLAFDE